MLVGSLPDNLDKLSFILVKDGTVVKISEPFIDTMNFTCEELLNKSIEEFFKTLRVSPSVNVHYINEEVDYYMFTKSHEVRMFNIEVVEDVNEKLLLFMERPNFDDKHPFLSKLCADNHFGMGIFSIPDITLLKANETFINFFDEPFNQKENCIGKRVSEFVTGFEGSTSEKIWQTIIDTGETYNIDEYMYDRLDRGVTYWRSTITPIYEDEKLKYCVEMTTDITEQVVQRKKIEEQAETIKQQKQELEAIIENMSDTLMVFDRNGDYILKNKAASDEAYAEGYRNVVKSYVPGIYFELDGNEVPFNKMPAYRVLRGETVKNQVLHCFLKGREAYITFSGTPVLDDKGELIFGVVSTRDISDIVKKEKDLKEAQKKLFLSEVERNKALEKAMEMKDEFLSLISHEFRTPLNVINTAIQAINYFCLNDLPDKARKYLDMIKINTFRQLRLVNNLLDITRADAGRIKINKKNLDIVFISKAITESVQAFASHKGITLDFISHIDNRIIGIDDEKYERILLNLLSNAIKFTPEGKSITVKLISKKNNVCIEVRDEGIGIPKDKIDIIFERFGQVDSSLSRQAEGTGIGLSLVKKFVEALGGSITVKSSVGRGSTFTILLPDETIAEANDDSKISDLMDNRLVHITNVEFSDIYI